MSPKTTFLGRRIGYNEEKRKRTRAMKIKNGAKKSLRWFRRRGWIIGLVLVILATAAWTNRFYLQRFNPMELRHLQYIDIEGNRLLTWEDVVQNAQVEPGMLLSEVFEDSVEKNLMQLPLIYKAVVEKHFPSSLTIIFRITTAISRAVHTGRSPSRSSSIARCSNSLIMSSALITVISSPQ